MRLINHCAILFLAALAATSMATAQTSRYDSETSRFEVSAGAGFSMPTGRAGNNLNNGWNLDFRGGYKPEQHLALDLDFSYNRWNLNDAALARYGEPNGYNTIWSFSFLPVLRGSGHWHVSPYVFGGPGIYYRNLTLTQPGTVNTIFCDPFFGVCSPGTVGVDQVVGSNSTYKGGVTFGAGLETRLGHNGLKVFGEARYARMFTTHGSDLTYVPVTFGVRW
jgi:opacity protein-like surface antigen